MSADAQPNPKQRANAAYPPEPPIGLPTRDKATVGALVSVVGPVFSLWSSISALFSASCAGIEPALISTTESPPVMDASASSGGPSRAASPTRVASTDDVPSQQVSRLRNTFSFLSKRLPIYAESGFERKSELLIAPLTAS